MALAASSPAGLPPSAIAAAAPAPARPRSATSSIAAGTERSPSVRRGRASPLPLIAAEWGGTSLTRAPRLRINRLPPPPAPARRWYRRALRQRRCLRRANQAACGTPHGARVLRVYLPVLMLWGFFSSSISPFSSFPYHISCSSSGKKPNK